jgi:hypothetical protein
MFQAQATLFVCFFLQIVLVREPTESYYATPIAFRRIKQYRVILVLRTYIDFIDFV